MNKALKYVLIAVPVLAGGAVIYWQVKKYKVPAKKQIPPISGNTVIGEGPSAVIVPVSGSGSTSSPAPTGCTFPLKRGSYNNQCVGQLQKALSITIDNDFGSKTEAALLAQTGKTQIASASELAAVLNQLSQKVAIQYFNTANLAQKIISDYGASLKCINDQRVFNYSVSCKVYKYLRVVTATTWIEVTKTTSGGWLSKPYQMSPGAGLQLNLADYAPVGVDNVTGNLIVYCNKGGNIGHWSVNPQTLVLV